jgi:catechol 2,3-dioxygenase-like lactoylglutathione lyase family enzyme
MRVTHLRHIGLITPKAEELVRFYNEVWGLHKVGQHEDVTYLRTASPEPYMVVVYLGSQNAIHHIAFGMSDRTAVDEAARELAAKGMQIIQEPGPLNEIGGGYGLRFIDPDSRCIELSCEVEQAGPMDWQAPVIPNKISHVVLNSSDLERATEFYTNILGFRVSDWSENQMVFLRCNTDHHSISFNRAPHNSLNHIAYELPSIDAVMRGIGNLKRNGTPVMWGPGRHGPGNNVFCYFQDAAGFVVEYTAEVQKIEDETAHEVKVWQRIPEQMDRWGTSGPPSPEARAAMAGIPDPGLLTNSLS